jgi:hypothetical protein
VEATRPPGEHQLRADAVRGSGEEARVVERMEAGETAESSCACGLGRGTQTLHDRDGGGK